MEYKNDIELLAPLLPPFIILVFNSKLNKRFLKAKMKIKDLWIRFHFYVIKELFTIFACNLPIYKEM